MYYMYTYITPTALAPLASSPLQLSEAMHGSAYPTQS